MNFFFANKVFFYTLVVIAFLVFLYVFPLSPPADFPAGIIFRVEHGSSLRSVSLKLKEENIIRSRLVFETFVILLGREKRVIEADYYFENKFPVYEVARRIGKGEHHLAPVVVTIPEGFDAVQIADAFVPKLVNFDKSKFLSEAAGLEGYLFPDTYFFQRTDTETDVIKSMRANFEKKMLSLKSDIALSGRTQREIIVMASLIEGEAKGEVDQALISGILWKRISIGMPLQVDAAFVTYKTKGLPGSPIGNPGMEALQAAIHPKSSPYLYYLHDKNGEIHYAKLFSEHRQNVEKYLKN
ncbi:MAG: Aminodeoxychorismate lyase [Parcubacteria group bacterium GW2011_GWA2_40_37]|nr:MAG: Aminodeoxychorismate lyase [Parcubacteria group bacterium GW2011_GWA2_40_37]